MIAFFKYQGLGNDFVVLDKRHDDDPLSSEWVVACCDRHRGIGADGILCLRTPQQDNALVAMQTHNADGSLAEVCGNGLRCVARYAFDQGLLPESQKELLIESNCQLYRAKRVASDRFSVEMGKAQFSHPDLPKEAQRDHSVRLSVEDRTFEATCVSLGNPHAVIFCQDGHENVMTLAERFGPSLSRHPGFPRQVNVSFARLGGNGIETVVFERGIGVTQACGSGAAAVGVAAVVRGFIKAESVCPLILPGGVLDVIVSSHDEVCQEGEAVRVFRGEVELS